MRQQRESPKWHNKQKRKQKVQIQRLNEIRQYERQSDQLNCSPYLADRVVGSCPRQQLAQSVDRVHHTIMPLAGERRGDWPDFGDAPPLSPQACAVDTLQVSRPLLVSRSWPVTVNLHHYVYAFLCVSPNTRPIIFTNLQTNIWQNYLTESRPRPNIGDSKNNS